MGVAKRVKFLKKYLQIGIIRYSKGNISDHRITDLVENLQKHSKG